VLILIAYLNLDHFPTLRLALIPFLLLTLPKYRLFYYWYLDPARQEEFNRNIKSLAEWIEGGIQCFRSGVKNSRVIELHDTNHYVFIVDEALVVREMRKFLNNENADAAMIQFICPGRPGGRLLAKAFGAHFCIARAVSNV
jgi:hypothetical protein